LPISILAFLRETCGVLLLSLYSKPYATTFCSSVMLILLLNHVNSIYYIGRECFFLFFISASSNSIFICSAPFFLAVNAIYGPEVSKELTPLWIIGPFVVALYIMMVRVLCSLYVYSFKQTVKVIKSLPSYSILAHSYIFHGKLKEDIKAHILQPILNIKNADYKQLTRKMLKVFSEWIREKYIDFVESIWPYYCRIIRFLKSSNLI
jgi:hypothetical protein